MLATKKNKKRNHSLGQWNYLQGLSGLGLPSLTSRLETRSYGIEVGQGCFGNELPQMGTDYLSCHYSLY